MSISQALLVFDYQSGKWVDEQGRSHDWYKCKVLRKPSKKDKEKGITGLAPYDRKDDGSVTYDLKIPADIRSDFPSFSGLPGFYLFDFELAGGSLEPVGAVEMCGITFPDD